MNSIELEGTVVFEGTVQPEWIDVNDHMNVAYYVLAFDFGTDALWDRFGISETYIKTEKTSTFAVESHVTYQKELRENDPYAVTSQILGFDEKRIHQFQRLYHAETCDLSATAEWLTLHVDLHTRRVAPWPESILSRIESIAKTQTGQSRPAEAGQRMQIKAPLYSL